MKNITKHVSIVIVMVMICALSSVSTVSAASKGTIGISLVTNGENFSSKRLKVLTVKQKVQLKVRYITGSKVKTVTNKAKYKTSNKKVISITKKGKMTAKKPGKCTITIKYGGKTKKLKFTIEKSQSAHVHNWKPYYETKRVQRVGIWHCNCGYQVISVRENLLGVAQQIQEYFKAKGLELPIDIYDPTPIFHNGIQIADGSFPLSEQHSVNHILNNESSNYWTLIAYEIVKYVDSYDCDCGAEKEPNGDEPEICTGEYVIDW